LIFRTPLKLFDIIEAQADYDELAVIDQLKGDAYAKNLTKNKNYLYDQIAFSLYNYHLKWSSNAQLMQKVRIIEIFIEKQLFVQAFKLLRNAKKKAYEYELYTELYLLIALEKRIPMHHRVLDYYSNIDLLKEQKKALRFTSNINDFESCYARFLEESENIVMMSGETQQKYYLKFLKEPLLAKESNCLTAKSLISFHIIVGNCHFRMRNHKMAYGHIKKTIEIFQAQKHLIYLEPMEYLNSIFNQCVSLAELFKFNDMFMALDKFKEYAYEPVMKKSKNIQQRIFEVQHYVPLVILNRLGEFKRADEIIKSILLNFDKHEFPELKKIVF